MDDQKHAAQVWNQVVKRQYSVLSDPGAQAIRKYGLVHPGGGSGQDIALDTTLLVDEQGRELWRRVSETIPDLPNAEETLERIRNSLHKSKTGSEAVTPPKKKPPAEGAPRC